MITRDNTIGAVVIGVLLIAPVTALPASGDLLITRDGSGIETRGPWEVRGRLVVFTRADGTLSSIHLRDVDLEASEEATAAAAAEEMEAEETSGPDETAEQGAGEKESAWVLTDADFTRRLIIEEEEEPGDSTADAAEDAAQNQPTRPPVVLNYQRQIDEVDRHVRITGTLANKSRATASSVALEVSLFDEQGDLIEMRRAAVDKTVLTPGAETPFEADFPDVFGFAAVQFRPRSVNLETDEGEGPRIPGPDDAAEGELGADEPPEG